MGLAVIMACDDKVAQFSYDSAIATKGGERLQVTYSWDSADGGPLEALGGRRD